MRPLPHGQATPPNVQKRDSGRITQVRAYTLITPLFGGGVEPAAADPVTVVRATEIRGHLRFWWRATRSGHFNGDLAAMKRREDAIWGTAAAKGSDRGPSQVQVVITDWDAGTPFQATDNRGNAVDIGHFRSPYSYVAFPLESGQTVQQDVQFTLHITYPRTMRDDIEAALWAWETFGGIGARTRRGFGALRLLRVTEDGNTLEVRLPPDNEQRARDWLTEKLSTLVIPGTVCRGVPHLGHPAQVVVKGVAAPLQVWKNLFEKLKRFRQDRFPDRRGGPGRGRSTWPEPSAIRDITRQSLTAHRTPIPNPAVHKFPRAAFGLPIIFQFKDANARNPNDRNADPRKMSLELQAYDRLASPLILKPLACDKDKAIGLALVLQGNAFGQSNHPAPPGEQPVLKSREGAPMSAPVTIQLSAAESSRIPMLHGDPDVLHAFLNYLSH
jgi:CRISPR-associated protein Cmr1